jgi:uncharacterized protein
MKNILDSITKYPLLFLIAALIFAAPFIAFLPSVKTVNNVDYFTLTDDPDVEFYDRFKEVFGNDEFFVIAFKKQNIFTAENLSLIKEITDELSKIEEVRDIISLSNVDDIEGTEDYFEVRKFFDEIPRGRADLEELKRMAVANPLYVKSLISPDGRTASIVVFTYNRPEDEDYRKKLIEKTQTMLEKYRHQVDTFYLAGWTVTNLRLSQYMKSDIVRFIPITYLLIAIAVYAIFRSIWLTILAVVNISVCLMSTMGVLGMSGATLNNVTSIVPPLIMALSLADTVHIFSQFGKRAASGLNRQRAVSDTLKKLFLPCFLTTVTTAAGFLSLWVSDIPPIKEFSWLASAGIAFAFFYSFVLLPPLLCLAPLSIGSKKKDSAPVWLDKVLRGTIDLVEKRGGLIVLMSIVLVIAACWFIGQIRVETNLVEYFKASSPVRQALSFVEHNISGTGSIDISLKAEDEDGFKKPENLRIIEDVQDYVRSLPGVDVVTSFVDFIKDMNESFHNEDHAYYRIPKNRQMVSQYLLLYDSEDIDDFINTTYDHARISARIKEHNSSAQRDLVEKIQSYIDKRDFPGLEIRITGRAVQDVNVIGALVDGQVYSLSIAVAVISAIMLVVFRSFSIGLLSLVPNMFPIVLNFGIMGALGIPLNTATAVIATVAIGIAVDDTIHFLTEYRRQRKNYISVNDSVAHAIVDKGRAIVSSSVILFIGFGVLIVSNFTPTVNFGMLTAIIMVTAVIGDLIILPSILLLKRGKFPFNE